MQVITEVAKCISDRFSAFFNGDDKPVMICVLLLTSHPKSLPCSYVTVTGMPWWRRITEKWRTEAFKSE